MALSFDASFDARHGEAVAVAPLVRRVTARNPGPFTFQGTNTFLIGREDLVVIDPGPDDPEHFRAVQAAIAGAAVVAILVTHRHRDHAPGARALAEATGAPVLAAGVKREPPWLSEEGARVDAAADSVFAPDRKIGDGDVIAGDGFRLKVIATPGHASDHLAFAMLGTDILFSGDHVMGWSTTVVAPPDGSMADYMRSLDKLIARPESTYLPAHGGAIRQAHVYVRGLRTHRRMRERAILDRLARGDATVAEIVASIYSDLAPRLRPAAASSTLAHLEDLVGRGLVLTAGTARMDGRYSRPGRGGGTPGAEGDEAEGADGATGSPPPASSIP